MKKDSNSIETTSRRQFTRAMVTAAVAAPIAASIVSCKGPGSSTQTGSPTPTGAPTAAPTAAQPATTGTSGKCPCEAITHDGYTEITFGGFKEEEHIPPMEIYGGGSLAIDSRNKLKTLSTGSGPFTYLEDEVADPDDRYGEIEAVMVVTETTTKPFASVAVYTIPLPGAQLLLWYQDIAQVAQGDDTDFPDAPFPDNDPDVRFVGGRDANPFRMTVKRKKLNDRENSHKKNRPHRYKHADGGNMARVFRIGQWRLVNSAGTMLVGDKGAENYIFFVRYGDIQ
jgi:hypothetical protein